jgi:lysyl-tRNA synthetase class 2
MSEVTQAHSTEAELIAVRREKLGKLRELGVDPYGAAFETTHTPGDLRADFAEGRQVRVAGRLTGLRNMGKSCFFHLGDVLGAIQGYLAVKELSDRDREIFECLDRGDWLGIEGETFLTRTGEPSVKVSKFTVLSKSLRPMPDKWHGVADREIRYRKRHLDLMSNEESAAIFVLRSRMLAEIRAFFHERGYLEVETPMLQDIPGGAAARPFET